MRIFFLLVLCSNGLICTAQKPAIDLSTLEEWPSSPWPEISNDGKYICYTIGSQPGVSTAIIQSSQDNWKIKLPGAIHCSLIPDSRQFVYVKQDSLFTGILGKDSITQIALTKEFETFSKDKNVTWLVYRQKAGDTMVIRNMMTSQERRIPSVIKYWVSENKKTILWEILVKEKLREVEELIWMDLESYSSKRIWLGEALLSLLMDEKGSSVAFTVDKNDLWYYGKEEDTVKKLVDGKSSALGKNFRIGGIASNSAIDHRVFFTYTRKDTLIQKLQMANVNIWSYKDAKLQSQQVSESINSKYYNAAVDTRNQHTIDLGEAEINRSFYPKSYKQDYLLVSESGMGNEDEWNWNPTAKTSVFLLSLKDGSRRLVNQSRDMPCNNQSLFVLSPQQKYVVYYNPKDKNYYSYNVSSGTVENLTQSVKTTWTSYDRDDEPASDQYPVGIAGFLTGDSSVLIYDRYDIFQIDLLGKKRPLNLTNGYGQKHNIVFHLRAESLMRSKEELILSAFKRTTKDEGFFTVVAGLQKDPTLLIMQPYKFTALVKARDKDAYLIKRMNASEYPNWFFTNDFKNLKRLTDQQPEKSYNWLTAELINFTTLDGKKQQGVLYKPENFDSHKKYPIIFHYYERKSNNIHVFASPSYFGHEIDIPYFVSNGYIVFTPDIHYKIGHPGQSAYNTIIGAAKYLIKFPWIDSKKMGLQGHSFGGFETLYLITHSHLFAAAMASSPMSDFISAYGSVVGRGLGRQKQYELYRDRIGSTLWQRQALYIENSPVLKADKVTTPLLMMSNDKDSDVPFQQGVEFFTALRRLEKKVWMLQYEGADHWALGDNAKDFTIRVKQFFDHYLKDVPPPKWMTKGIPAKLKGIEDGLELDTTGSKP